MEQPNFSVSSDRRSGEIFRAIYSSRCAAAPEPRRRRGLVLSVLHFKAGKSSWAETYTAARAAGGSATFTLGVTLRIG
jgi:hypothetical protein